MILVLDISGMACQFPYGADSTVSMTIFLPNENVKLEVLEKELSAAKIKELLEVPIEKEKVNVSLPKIKLQFEAEVCALNLLFTNNDILFLKSFFFQVIGSLQRIRSYSRF